MRGLIVLKNHRQTMLPRGGCVSKDIIIKEILLNGSTIDSAVLHQVNDIDATIYNFIMLILEILSTKPMYCRGRERWTLLTTGCFYRMMLAFLVFVRDLKQTRGIPARSRDGLRPGRDEGAYIEGRRH
ncbi:hypothetical protein WN48_07470 [Eufriesea mexicana]|uniref:Uncharacterized protein n=1 Tax=Eufriesea mexicana TaxID=516756 RepID=A0A310SX14_9HYME|nr:hypothetical protein WN48_07470 [Eufriesea mexicana]